jgi:hypothetical protein
VGNIKRILAQNQKLPVKTFSAAVFAEDYFKQHFEINPVARLSINCSQQRCDPRYRRQHMQDYRGWFDGLTLPLDPDYRKRH